MVGEFKAGLRFQLLETVRGFASEQLEATGRAPERRRRHVAAYSELAVQLGRMSRGSSDAEAVELARQAFDGGVNLYVGGDGRASVLGIDPQADPVAVRARVGYLPGELALYANMKASRFFEMVEYLRFKNGKAGYWREVAERLDLDTTRKIREFDDDGVIVYGYKFRPTRAEQAVVAD